MIIFTDCHKTYDCTCTTEKGQSLKVGTVSAAKNRAKELCAENVNRNASATFTSCTINE